MQWLPKWQQVYLLNISNSSKKMFFLLGSSGSARFSLNHTRNQLDEATRKQLRRPFEIALRPFFARAPPDRGCFRANFADFVALPSPSWSASKFARTSLRDRQFRPNLVGLGPGQVGLGGFAPIRPDVRFHASQASDSHITQKH